MRSVMDTMRRCALTADTSTDAKNKLLKRLEENYVRGGGGSGRDGRTRTSDNCGSVTFPAGTGSATAAALGAGGVRPNIEPRTVMAWSFTARMTHTFAPDSDFWCIGHAAPTPWGQVQSVRSTTPAHAANGVSMTLPIWHDSHSIAVTASRRREPVMSDPQ
jgi:hypothetical protein